MSGEQFDRLIEVITEMRGDLQAEIYSLRAEMRDRFDRLETKTDTLSREMERVLTRLSAAELNALGGQLNVAALQSRLNDHGVRIELIEKRLELRDRP